MPTPWETAKGLLISDISEGKVSSSMSPTDVQGMREEYQLVPYANFRTNLRNLRTALQKNDERAAVDQAAFEKNRKAFPILVNPPGFSYPRWDGSLAQGLLKQDIDEGRNNEMRPQQLQKTRVEYAPFPKDVFRKHIDQEIRSRKDKAYWMVRQQKKNETKHKKAGKTAAPTVTEK